VNIQPYHIITRPQILALLRRITENRSLLTVKIEGFNDVYSSTVLAINTRKNLLAIDEPFPQAYEPISRNTTLHCYTRLDGISISFSCKVHTKSRANGSYCYELSIPDTINHHQRRRHYRVPLSWTNATLSFTLPDQSQHDAIVTDMSISGIGAALSAAKTVLLEKNIFLIKSILNIANNPPIDADLQVRSIRADTPDEPVYFGARFVNLETTQAQLLQQLVTQLDRESCQINAMTISR